MRELALFAGAGGGVLGGVLLGWRTVCAVEIDPYCRSVLLARQRDGMLPRFPIWDDVKTFDGIPWREHVDVISGGFPCQDISCAGKGAGIVGARSGLWSEFARVIGEVRPRYAFVENSPMLRTRGLDRVLCDLARLGYNARWGVISAENTGAPHQRKRTWILADSSGYSQPREGRSCTGSKRKQKQALSPISHTHVQSEIGTTEPWSEYGYWSAEPAVGRVAYGVAHRVDRLRAVGNGQVPAVAELAWEILSR